jgi:hypothetical protein
MATTNTAIAVYLPPDIEEKVREYCKDNNLFITRQGETSERMGTGIVKLLESFFNGGTSPQPAALVPDAVSREELDKAIANAKAELLGVIEKKL